MPLSQIVDHTNRAVDRLAQQFRESGFLKGLIGVFSGQVQAAEDGIWGMLQAIRSVATATDTTLDRLGALVGTPYRGTKNDAAYRNRINTQIIANRGSGEATTIYSVAKLTVTAWNVSGQPAITEHPPGAYEIACTPRASVVNNDAEARELAGLLGDISGAGIRGIVISQQVAAGSAFAFDGGTGLGFGAGDFTAAYDK